MRSVELAGAKNSILPLAVSKLIVDGTTRFVGHPRNIVDLDHCVGALAVFGVTAHHGDRHLEVTTRAVRNDFLSRDRTSKTRYSSVFLGPLASTFGRAAIALPGGCSLGERPLDIHLRCFEHFGYQPEVAGDRVTVTEKRSVGGSHRLRFPSVGGTINFLLLSAVGATTRTLENAAREPEIANLIEFLNSAGAQIKREDDTIQVEGVPALRAESWTVPGDRIEALTFITLAMLTRTDVELRGVNREDISAALDAMAEMGLVYEYREETRSLRAFGSRVDRVRPISLMFDVFPGIPTDAQPLFAALCTAAGGVSTLEDRVFPDRFQYASEFARLGVKMERGHDGRVTIHPLNKDAVPDEVVEMTCPDIRGGAAILLLAISLGVRCRLRNFLQVRRGYDALLERITALGFGTSQIEVVD